MTKRILPHKDNWLAAEYALGVLDQEEMSQAEAKYYNEIAFRHTVDDWHIQFEPFLDEVKDVTPHKMVWKKIENKISGNNTTVKSGSASIWKFTTALASTLAVASVGALMFVTEGDFTGQQSKRLEQELAEANAKLSDREIVVTETTQLLNDTRDKLKLTNEKLTNAESELVQAKSDAAEIRRAAENAKPLVASLSQSGDAPSFIAQFDPFKNTLFIRTTLEDNTEKVPEIWLIPSGGPRDGEVLSLGVMNEKTPDEIKLNDAFSQLLTKGGTLAITMEPPGGAPEGVATGPIIALGKLQAFDE